MIEVHHLNASRSRRITWLFEELVVEYQLVTHQRDAGAPLQPRIQDESANHLGFLNARLDQRNYFVGDDLTGADVQLSFVAQLAVRFLGRDAYPDLAAFADRIEARPAYQRAMTRAGA